MMIADTELGLPSPRSRRSPPGSSLSAAPRGMLFALASVPGPAVGFHWPTWLSPLARNFPPSTIGTSSKGRH